MTWKYIKASKHILFGQNIVIHVLQRGSYAAEVVKHIGSGQNTNEVQKDLKLITPLWHFPSGILSLCTYPCTYLIYLTKSLFIQGKLQFLEKHHFVKSISLMENS